jgi:hypothetical protein
MNSLSLTKKDYMAILKYYKINTKNKMNYTDIKHKAEQLLASKLCKCIKNVTKKRNSENRAIAVCRKSVIQNKGLDIFKFTCKKKTSLIPKKNTKIKLKKLSKTIKISI